MHKFQKIPVSRPNINTYDVQSVSRAIRSTFIATGPLIEEFEQKIAKYCGRKYAIAVTSGTSALFIALKATNLPPGSKILVPSFTIISALYAILMCGYVPVFTDVDESTWNINEKILESKIKDGVRAAIIVQTYSSSPPMEKIRKILKKNRIILIEDAAEGFGGGQNGMKFGSFGEMSILSFYANKLITTGEGGMVLTDNLGYYKKLFKLRNLFFGKNRDFIHEQLSGNYRMTNYQAALGLSQLANIAQHYAHRRGLYKLYKEKLVKLKEYIEFQYIPDDITSSYWVFPIMIRKKNKTARQLIAALAKDGIEARHFFYPLDKQPFLPKEYQSSTQISYNLWLYGLYLPLGNGISRQEVMQVIEVLKKVIVK